MNEWMKCAIGAIGVYYVYYMISNFIPKGFRTMAMTCLQEDYDYLYLQRHETGLYLIGCNWRESINQLICYLNAIASAKLTIPCAGLNISNAY